MAILTPYGPIHDVCVSSKQREVLLTQCVPRLRVLLSLWTSGFLEEVLYDLPPLEGIFLHWHMQGMSATTAGIISLLARRKQLLGSTTLSGASIQLLYACAKDTFCSRPGQEPFSPWGSRPLHTRLLRHGSAHSAAEMQALLPPGVLVHKTISFTLADTIVLCTGVGTQCLTRRHLRTIAAALVRHGPNVKQWTINPAPGSSVKKLAMHPELVSPFLHPSRHAGLAALALLPWSDRWEGHEPEVAISLSLWESLVLPLRCLYPLIRSYAKRAYPTVRVIELESEGTADAYTDEIILSPRSADPTSERVPGHLETGGACCGPCTAYPTFLKMTQYDEGG